MNRTHHDRDKFAELLSRDLTIDQICKRMGLSRSSYQGLLYRLRKDLGWQAQ